ncbi:hypothetical protein DYQ94_04905 [Xanthomonas sp. LMG 8993]|nr:hypothetical protein [Xanthomonas sp. LMG 8993]QWM98972.1 hypothetical protein DGN21_06265 [Xanthomonas sp. MLO165]
MHACRRGTLSGMDAAPEPTGTYLRRVPRRYACKRPRQTAAFAWNRQRSCTRLPGLRSWSAARRRMQCRDTPGIHPWKPGVSARSRPKHSPVRLSRSAWQLPDQLRLP